jgi:hypothetical protein
VNTHQLRMPKRRKHLWAILFGMAAIALAIGGLAQPAVSHAEAVWDIGAYDSCARAADNRLLQTLDYGRHADEIRFCCDRSGGQWSQAQGCTAPPITAPPPQSPGEVIQAPGTGTATQQSPVDVGQAPQPGPVIPTPPAPRRYTPGWGI